METWERRVELPLMGVALVFLIAYAWPILDPAASAEVVRVCELAQLVAWAAFAGDYVVRLRLATDRRMFLRTNVLDLLVIALPLLRPMRLLRLVTLLRVVNRTATHQLRGRVVSYVVGGSILLALIGALAILDAERGVPGSTIQTIGDAAWWAVTTMSSVGYGDMYPVTALGRWIAVGLMVSGIGILGTVTATLASWLTDRLREETAAAEQSVLTEVHALRDEIQSLRQQLAP